MQPTVQNGICIRCKEPEASAGSNGDNALAPGTSLGKGRITVGKKLGSGGFGVTYIAFDNKLKRRVALKEFMPNYLAVRKGTDIMPKPGQNELYQKSMNSFMKEARALYELRAHPNIVHVLSVFRENNTAYYTMEMLEGESFLSYLKRKKRISGNRAFQMLIPIMKAIQYVHTRKMIHRDISPDNIMLCEDPSRPGSIVPKLIDFGAAHVAIEGYSLSYPGVKKNGFSPLEQNWEGKAQGPWTDVYSFCATFYCALVGNVPVSAQVRSESDRDPLRPPGEMGADISPEMQDVLMRGLKLRYEERIQTMEQLIGEMTKAVGKTATPSVAEAVKQTVEDPRRPAGRRICAWILEVMLAAACVLLLKDSTLFSRIGLNGSPLIIAILLVPAAVFLLDLVLLLSAGSTAGQLLFGIRTCGEDGEGKPGISSALAYSLLYASYGLPAGAVLGLIWLASGKNIGPLEKLCGVTVKPRREPAQNRHAFSGVISGNISETDKKQEQPTVNAPVEAAGERNVRRESGGKEKQASADRDATLRPQPAGEQFPVETVRRPPSSPGKPVSAAAGPPSSGTGQASGPPGGPRSVSSGQAAVTGQPRLICLRAADTAAALKGKSIAVRPDDRLGKNPQKARIVIRDQTVSGLHCSFHFEPGKGWSVRDENSTNGTYVNGTRIPPAGNASLKSGTKIAAGKEIFEFRC